MGVIVVAVCVILIFSLICLVGGIVQYIKSPKPPDGLSWQEYNQYYYNKEWDREKKITEYLEKGKKLQAIKELRTQTGCSLADAKAAVEQLEISLKRRGSSQVAFGNSISAMSIDGMDGHDFEYFCASLLRKNGFSDVSVTPGSGDQGVDILAVKGGVRYAVQCKNYSTPLGNTPVQEVTAGKQFYNCHVGVVMTNSTFTTGAIDLANATGVLLWDGSVVHKMMESANEE